MTEHLQAPLSETIASLPRIDLDALAASASRMTRHDRKYVVPTAEAIALVESLAPGTRVLEIDHLTDLRYESTYFDTPELRSFHEAAWRRPRRFKVRTRAYIDTGRCTIELKLRDPRGGTTKSRLDHDLDQRRRLDVVAREFVATSPLVAGDAARLEPVLRTVYRRSTLLLDGVDRLTLDRDVGAVSDDGRCLSLVGMAVIETKTGGPPSSADRVLWRMGYRPMPLSKYGTSLAVLRPDLPSNRWTRALRYPWVHGDSSDPSRLVADQRLG